MPEARIATSSKSARYTIKELIKANNKDKIERTDKMDYTVQDSNSVRNDTRLCSTSQNTESNDILSNHEESLTSSSAPTYSQNHILKDPDVVSVQQQNSSFTGSSGNVFH